jgi:hypothetical protein
VSDSDGEFLLIEAAKVTPKWLSPENDANRVWIHDGKLFIIPLSSSPNTTTAPSSNKPLTLASAISTLKTAPLSTLVHSPLIESESFYRLEKYPAQIPLSTHHALATLPRKLAYLLHARPKSIAPATEAFYTRDPRALKPILSASLSSPPTGGGAPLLTFPPTDLVTVSVRFTKVLYAQLRSQHFAPPAAWKPLLHAAEVEVATAAAAAANDAEGESEAEVEAGKKLARLEMGMKLTTGFELLAQTAGESSNRVVREVALLLEDLDEDGGESALPTDGEIRKWEGVEREDDDKWMDIDFADFERELEGKGKSEAGGFGDAAAQADLQKMVSRFEAFLNDESAGIDGAEVDEMDRDYDGSDGEDEDEESDGYEDEDQAVSFDEEQFARMMREMMGLPGDDGRAEVKGNAAAVGEKEEGQEDNEDEEIRKMMEQMESELKGFGALDLDPKPKAAPTIKEKGEGSKTRPVASYKDDEDEESDEAVDIDYNLAKNLLESFKSQAGMAGPAGNLLGLMGMNLPRDEDDSNGDQRK